jgi:hypothetical protein
MIKFFSGRVKGDSNSGSWNDWVAKQKKSQEKTASSEKLTKEASKEEKKAESKKDKVVFASSNPKVKDGKHHYPINNVKQAADALKRMAQYEETPKWFDGTLDELKSTIVDAVTEEFPKVAQEELAVKEASSCGSCGEEVADHTCASIPEPEETVEIEVSDDNGDEDKCYFCMDCAKNGCASDEVAECECSDDECVCGCKEEESVPGEQEHGDGEIVVISDPVYAGFKGKFTVVSKLTPKDKKWLQSYFSLYYPQDYAKALVQDY